MLSQLEFGKRATVLGRLGAHGRLPDPPDRRVLLDQGRLAGRGGGLRRARARQPRLRPEPRRVFHRIHLCRRREGVLRLPPHQQDADRFCHLHPRHEVAQFSGNIHAATVRRYKNQRIAKDNIVWTPQQGASALGSTNGTTSSRAFATIGRTTKPAGRSTPISTALMGRAACHTGQTVTWEQMMKSDFQFCDHLDQLDADSRPPVEAGRTASSRFPFRACGRKSERSANSSPVSNWAARPGRRVGRAQRAP